MRRLAALVLLALTIAWPGPPVAAARAAPSPAHDASGNVVDNGTNLGGFAFSYDFSNQPTAVTIAGAPYPYVYDGDLKRVKHARPGGQTIYTAYSRVSGKPILRYVEPEQSYFDWTEGVGPMEVWFFRGALHSYRHLDAQGSVMADSNAAGGVGFSERYTPFGERLIGTTNHHNPGYTGHVRDGDTGLNYMQARLYDPVIGRFLSTDPIGYQDQLNLYAYVANDPVNKIDPNGEQALDYSQRYAPTSVDSSRRIVQDVIPAIAGFSPGLGDAMGIADALQNPTPTKVVAAGIGIVPAAGDLAGKSLKAAARADSSADAVRLQKQLASESQMTQLSEGGGTIISQPADQAARVAAETGADPNNIQKVTSDAFTSKDGQQIQTHAFRDASTNEIIQPKTIIDDRIK